MIIIIIIIIVIKKQLPQQQQQHTQPFYSSLDFVRDNPGELVPEGTFSQQQQH